MSKEKYIIVGGGVTGVVTALNLKNKNKEVEMYELKESLGGVLEDYSSNDKKYFNSCQYINAETYWAKDLLKNYKKEFIEFEHKYGSYTDLFDEEVASNDFAGITINKSKNIELLNTDWITLYDRLNSYPKNLSQPILSWVERFNINPKLIDGNGAIGLQVSRIFIRENANEILVKKQKLKHYDDLYGLPRSYLRLGKLRALLPINGYSNLFRKIYDTEFKGKIVVNFKSPTVPFWSSENKLSIKIKNENYESKKIIWTCNPTALIRFYNGNKIDSIKTKMTIYVADLENIEIDPFYIQVFSKKMSIVRIFIYKIANKSKITIECFNEDIDYDNLITSAQMVLNKFDLNIKIIKSTFMLFNQVRYFLTTLNDQKIFNDFYNQTRSSNLINGQWNLYGRDQKILNIENQLENT